MPTYFDQIDVTGGVPVRGSTIYSSATSPIQVRATNTHLVEGQSSQGGIDGNFTGLYSILTSITVKSGAGFLNGITINNRIGQNIYIFDSTSKVAVRATASVISGTVSVLSFPANNTIAPLFIPFQRKFTKGLQVVVRPLTSTSVTNLSFSYR